jgi:hypothetical protein
MVMRQERAIGWRFAAAFVLTLFALTAGTFAAGKYGPANLALADEEPDFLVLNPEHE